MKKSDIAIFKKLVNQELYSKCFLSTSVKQDLVTKFALKDLNSRQVPVIFEIDIELGYMNDIGRDISQYSRYPEREKEWLLPYGSLLKVISVHEHTFQN